MNRRAEKDVPGRTRLQFADIFPLIKKTYHAWSAHDPFRQSAVIAYYAIFSLPGLLVIIIALAGFVFGAEAVTGQLSAQIGSLMGQETAKQIEEMVAKASISDKSFWATIIALITIIIGGTAVFAQLQKSLNLIWEVEEVKEKPKRQFFRFLKTRLLSFGLVLSLGFMMIISLLATTIIALVGEWFKGRLPETTLIILPFLDFIFSFCILTTFFALMFKFLPDAKINWRQVWIGSIGTSLLFALGKFALGLYFGKAEPASNYGAAGSVILIMLWVSYSCMIFFFGAEFTKQQTEYVGKGIAPKEHAVKDSDAAAKIKK